MSTLDISADVHIKSTLHYSRVTVSTKLFAYANCSFSWVNLIDLVAV